MKAIKTLLALTLPLAFSAGCALDVGSSADGLTIETAPNFAGEACGGLSSARWLAEDTNWPIETIIAGDMEFSKEELTNYIVSHPGNRSALLGEMAAAQLNMVVGFILPNDASDELVNGDNLIAPPDGTPPPISVGDFDGLRGFNLRADRACVQAGDQVAEILPGRIDVRPDLVLDPGGVHDIRPDIAARH